MKRLNAVVVVLLLLAAAVSAQDWKWEKFSPPGGEFTLDAPGKLVPDDEAREAGSRMGSYSYNDFYGYFGVVYREWKKSAWRLKPDFSNHYKKVRNDFVKASKGELVSEETWTKGEVTGRNVRIKIPYGTITGVEGKTIPKFRYERLRMMFVGQRFYLLVAVLPADVIDTPQVDRFFDSFEAK